MTTVPKQAFFFFYLELQTTYNSSNNSTRSHIYLVPRHIYIYVWGIYVCSTQHTKLSRVLPETGHAWNPQYVFGGDVAPPKATPITTHEHNVAGHRHITAVHQYRTAWPAIVLDFDISLEMNFGAALNYFCTLALAGNIINNIARTTGAADETLYYYYCITVLLCTRHNGTINFVRSWLPTN